MGDSIMESRAIGLVSVCLTLAIVAGLDYISGHKLNFFVFYYIPTAMAAWWLGLYSAVAVAVVSAVLWFWTDLLSGREYLEAFEAVWNTVIRLTAFLIIAVGGYRMRKLVGRERQAAESLRRAFAELTVLQGILPICASCKKIRNPENQWQPMEQYITDHSEARFSHGLCPDCARRFMEEAGLTGQRTNPPSGNSES